MNERLLQFIWQFQYFNKGDLLTTGGESVQVIAPGQYNTDQGPDFSNAKIKIGSTIWAGTVELHIHPADWNKHHHHTDKNYQNVILHVVWEKDKSKLFEPDKVKAQLTSIPELELKGRVPGLLLNRYEELIHSSSFIPCEHLIPGVPVLILKSWKDRLAAERLERKSAMADFFLQQSNYHWEETFWWLLARNFGMKVNAESFEALARSVSLTTLAKHKNQIHQVEALLLGQAGLLEGHVDDYAVMLQKEYQFLKKKYSLKPVSGSFFFLRMRPGNFPTIRLAQLAMLVHESAHLFSKIREAGSVQEIKKWFTITANDYWHYHYRFDDLSSFRRKKLGGAMVDNIIINTIAPVIFSYGKYHRQQAYKDKAMDWLEKVAAERNKITKGFQQIGIGNQHALDSQALIELKNEYCNKKKCLDCGIGNAILKN